MKEIIEIGGFIMFKIFIITIIIIGIMVDYED